MQVRRIDGLRIKYVNRHKNIHNSWANDTKVQVRILSLKQNLKIMTKQEALLALANGKKVTHRTFTNDEYIYREGSELMCECGFLDEDEFWDIRDIPAFDVDWSIYNK